MSIGAVQERPRQPMPGRRIVVVGTSGSGKTFVAKALAGQLGLHYVCNDAIIWKANWQPTPRDERLSLFDEATSSDTWAYDGNILAIKDPEDHLILGRADTVIWIDLPRRIVFKQVILRTIKRVLLREELWHGNRETFRMSFLSRDSIILWSIRTYTKRRCQCERFFRDPKWDRLIRVRLRSRHEVWSWLDGVVSSDRRDA